MADQLCDVVESREATTLLDKLPGRRIDAFVRDVAAKDPLQQGVQTGGYTPSYGHLSHLLLFPLYSVEQLETLTKKCNTSDLRNFGKTDINFKAKGASAAMNYLDGGGGLGTITAAKWLGRTIIGLEAVAANMGMEQIQVAVATRWIVPAQQGVAWFVDVFENRWADPNSTRGKMAKVSGNVIMLKAGLSNGSKVAFKVLNKEVKGVKSQKTWWTRTGVERSCDAIILIDGGAEIHLELVARIQRPCSVLEGREMQKRFEKQWKVPVPL